MNSMKGGCCGGGEDRGEILCSTFSSKRLYLFIAIWRIWKNDKKLVFIVTFWWFETKPLRLFSCHEAEESHSSDDRVSVLALEPYTSQVLGKLEAAQGLRSSVLTASTTLEQSLRKAK